MALEMKVPSPGESITEVEIAQWLVADGDYVEKDQPIAELDSDKATLELPAEASGKITLKAEEGDAVKVGAVVCLIDTEAKKSEDGGGKSEETSAKATDSEGEEKSEDGSQKPEEASDEDKDSEETEEKKSTKEEGEEPKEESGKEEDDSRLRGNDKSGESKEKEKEEEEESPKEKAVKEEQDSRLRGNDKGKEEQDSRLRGNYAEGTPSPAAKKILDEKGIKPEAVSGTGKDGRITKEDAVKAKPSMGTPTGGNRGESRKKLSMLRRKVAERLVSAKNETAMLTTFNEVDMSAIFGLRKKYKEQFQEKHDVSLGFMSFFTLAVVRALKEFPTVNSMIDGQEMISYDYCDISIAVSGPKGLMVPVIRNAENLSFRGVESEVKRLATKARDGKITVDEMTGGTFTISNGGVFGSMLSTPIINPPQSGILGMHNIVERPVAIDGHVEIRPIMFVALSYDHRIIDGRESVGFLVEVKKALESPEELLMDGDVKRALEL